MLNDIDKLCFSCPLPAERCGDGYSLCRFMEATQDRKYLRAKSSDIQTSCGFEEKPLFGVKEMFELKEIMKKHKYKKNTFNKL
jgi:hypothetical protein